MLVLSRKKNESIVINNDIVVTVVEIRGDKVRLGIVAPKEVPVHRQEVYDAIHGKEPADAPTRGRQQAERNDRPPPVTGARTGRSDSRPGPARSDPLHAGAGRLFLPGAVSVSDRG